METLKKILVHLIIIALFIISCYLGCSDNLVMCVIGIIIMLPTATFILISFWVNFFEKFCNRWV